MKTASMAILFFLAGILSAVPVSACTVFVLDDGQRHYYGSNYDWHIGFGYVMVNPRGVSKQGWSVESDPGQPARWRSRYGSVTFVQYGQGLPKGGMNEAGLVIEGLLLFNTEYPVPDERPYVGSSAHFKQYLLDNCATVADAVQGVARIRLTTGNAWAPGVHFMVADRSGDCAVMEYLQGRLVVYRGNRLPLKVLTNHPYALTGAAEKNPGPAEFDMAYSSVRRFSIVAERLAGYEAERRDAGVAYALETLSKAASGDATQWQQVYDQSNAVVYWRTRDQQQLRWIDLKPIDFSCTRTTVALPVQSDIEGEANRYLSPFPIEANVRLVHKAMSRSRNRIPVPEELWDRIGKWPQHEVCGGF